VDVPPGTESTVHLPAITMLIRWQVFNYVLIWLHSAPPFF
jgi:hypothetical protein